MFWLAVGLAVPAVAALLVVIDGERIALSPFPQFPLPTACLSRNLFGIECPGCGLTRSIVYLVHGEWSASWQMHRLGGLIFVLIVAQVPYRAWRLTRSGQTGIRAQTSQQAWWLGLAVLLVLDWFWHFISRG